MKRILGLDLGTASIGWALVNEAENENEKSSIVKLGVRVNPLSSDELTDFEKGRPLSVNADRTLKRGARRNLQRFKLRRKNLIEILQKNNLITKETRLSEHGKGSTHETLELRSKAAKEKVSLGDFARILLTINKKRGYKSSRKTAGEDEGIAVDGMSVAKVLYEKKITPGQYVYDILKSNKKSVPEFYRSDLQNEFDLIWKEQLKWYSSELKEQLYNELLGKAKNQTWAICAKYLDIKGIKLEGKANQVKLRKFELRTLGLNSKLDLEHLVIVLQEINGELKNSSGYLGAISDRSKELYFNDMTVGEFLYSQLLKNPHQSLKNQVFYRQDYLDEFERIWETQARYHSALTDDLKDEIRDVVIFYQRKLKSQKGLISFCQFESWREERKDEKGNVIINELTGLPKTRLSGKRVIPKSSPLFQEFKIWQNLGHLKFSSRSSEDAEKFVLNDLDRNKIFEELNIKGELKCTELFKILGLNSKEWKCNFDKVEGNRTNRILYDAFQKILETEGYGFDWKKKSANEIKEEVSSVFKDLGIDADVLVCNRNMEDDSYFNQKSYQLWHLLYSAQDDEKTSEEDRLIYGNSDVNLKKNLSDKFGFKPEHSKILANLRFGSDYGSLSARAIKKIMPHLEAGNSFSEACALAQYNHSNSLTKEENLKRELKEKLELLPKNSLRNPVVEKILNQLVNLTNQIIDSYGKPDEVRIELARELKKSANERKEMTSFIYTRTEENKKIKQNISKEFGIPNPTKNDVVRYRLYQELKDLGHKTVFTNQYIPKNKLFSKEIDIEHIIPKAILFDDSFSNKTLAYRKINLQKSDRTALDFIESDFNNDLDNYKQRVETLYANGKGLLSKSKYKKLLTSREKLPDGFIERDLRNSQYIAKKAKSMLLEISRNVVSTSGSITDKLREDWDLVNVMKELNLPKYRALGLTEFEVRKDNKRVEVIKDWTKRNDHRHHAMDALTVAFTTHNHIQYLNNLNTYYGVKGDGTNHEKSQLFALKNKITKVYDERGNRKRKFIPPVDNFRSEAKKHIEEILVSFKSKNKVVTRNRNKTKIKGKNNYNSKIQLTPRGQLHKETVYGKSKQLADKPLKINKRISIESIHNIAHPRKKEIILAHLAKFENDIAKAFDTKILKEDPLLHNDEPITEVPIYKDVFTIRKEITPDLKVDKVIDEKIKEVLYERLKEYGNKPKEAFSNLDEKPIWLNKKAGISIKRVTIKGVANAEPLHEKRDHYGTLILDENGNKIPTDYVSTGNNHHVAIYEDEEGKLHEQVVSFYEAVHRVNQNLPIIDKTYNSSLGWKFKFSMKQNEMFLFPSDDFNPQEIDVFDPKNNSMISKNLFRVQNIASKDYRFRSHLESTVTVDLEFTYKRKRNPSAISGCLKIRLNHLGEVVQKDEY